MLRIIAMSIATMCVIAANSFSQGKDSGDTMKGFYSFTMKTIDGTDKALSAYKGSVLLVVNTASECGYTPQYEGLEALYRKYKDRGLKILAFPANDFHSQEPGTDSEIKTFCTTKYHVTFDLFSKIVVLGDDMNPLYAWLTSREGYRGPIAWNFNKFLIGRDGMVAARYPSKITPQSAEIASKLEELLGK